MDASSQMDYLDKGVKGAIMSPNEARAKIGLAAVPGGESPMIQQQNFSLAAIAKRDSGDPFAKAATTTPDTEETQGADDGLGNA